MLFRSPGTPRSWTRRPGQPSSGFPRCGRTTRRRRPDYVPGFCTFFLRGFAVRVKVLKTKKAPERACKPGPVPRAGCPGEATVISLGRRLPDASSGLTRERGRATRLLSYLALLRVGFAEPTRSPAPLVSSYLTVSPLPLFRAAVCFLWHWSVGSPPLAVSQHPALRSPDFPPAALPRPATVWPSLARNKV